MFSEHRHQRALLAELKLDGLLNNLSLSCSDRRLESMRGWQPPSIDHLNAVFDRVEVSELLGCGSMGAVYRARQSDIDRDVAVKILPQECNSCPDLVERFRQEACAVAQLQHPNILTIHYFGQTADGGWYFINELVDGVTLKSWLDDGPVNPSRAIVLAIDICEALQHAHDAGLIHRDIKPGNILINGCGRAIVADFGVVAVQENSQSSDLTADGQFVGTEGYAAPEQLNGRRNIDHRADLYSLGVLLYEMLTGQRPMGSWAPPSQVNHDIPTQIDSVIRRLLAPEAADRYDSAATTAAELRNCLPQNSEPTRKRRMVVGVVSLILAACLGGVEISRLRSNGIVRPLRAAAIMSVASPGEDLQMAATPASHRPALESDVKNSESSDPDARTILKSAAGFWIDSFALFHKLPLDQLESFAAAMRTQNAVPVSLKPYIQNRTVFVAGVFRKASCDWKLVVGVNREELEDLRESRQQTGWTLKALAGYWHRGRKFVGVWMPFRRVGRDTAPLWSLNTLNLDEKTPFTADVVSGHTLSCWHPFYRPDGTRLDCTVWKRFTNDAPQIAGLSTMEEFKDLLESINPNLYHRDITLICHDDHVEVAHVWNRSHKRESKTLIGISIAEHKRLATQLSEDGWKPGAVSVLPMPAAESVVASVWYRSRLE